MGYKHILCQPSCQVYLKACRIVRIRLQDSRFSQQELPAWKPILTPGWVIATFAAIGIIFIPDGLASLFSSECYCLEMDC
ncbi:ALA-interacting subunit 1 [Spatholobus suberectus]|nr:ALA-interacting subunit 1 [Spatholobus suberectus]